MTNPGGSTGVSHMRVARENTTPYQTVVDTIHPMSSFYTVGEFHLRVNIDKSGVMKLMGVNERLLIFLWFRQRPWVI